MREGFVRLAVLALAVVLGGCAIDDSGPVRSVWRPANGKPTYSNVVYVTDRQPDAGAAGGFNTRWADKASCGTVLTIVPAALVPGEKPEWGYVDKTTPTACAKGDRSLAGAVALIEAQAKAKNCHSVFLFIHGFHTGFDGGVLRAAQVAHDAQTGCAVAAFSWSAEINVDHYVSDLEHSDFSEPFLAEFLRELAESNLRVTILGHSLGSRLVLATLSGLAHGREPVRPGFIDELVLAAADVGADPANDDFVHLMQDAATYAKRTTVYISKNDSVLYISEREHGGVPRLGSEPGLAAGRQSHEVDIIDASDAPADVLDHSYYAMSPETMADMTLALDGVPLQDRLTAGSGWPATLACRRPCDGHAAIAVAPGRAPRLITRIIINVLPLVPLVQ
jgi:esterase/lipase superfamily enzyme